MINVNYGPISAALGMAQTAGAGQGNVQAQQLQLQKRQQDMAFINMVQQAQAQADQEHANEISQGIGVQEFNANLDMRGQAAQVANQQQQIENDQANRRIAISQQNEQANAANDQARQSQAGADAAAREAYRRQQQQNFDANQARLANAPDEEYKNSLREMQESRRRSHELNTEIAQNNKVVADVLADDVAKGRAAQEIQRLSQEREVENNNYKALQDRHKNIVQQQDQALKDKKQGIAPAVKLDQRTIDQAVQQGGVMPGEQVVPHNGTAPDNRIGNLPVIHTLEEYQALPSGATYINGQTGQRAQKP
jgi:hypothetical protein